MACLNHAGLLRRGCFKRVVSSAEHDCCAGSCMHTKQRWRRSDRQRWNSSTRTPLTLRPRPRLLSAFGKPRCGGWKGPHFEEEHWMTRRHENMMSNMSYQGQKVDLYPLCVLSAHAL